MAFVALSVSGARPVTFRLENTGQAAERQVAPGGIGFLPLIGPELDPQSAAIAMDSAASLPARTRVLTQSYSPQHHVYVPDECADGYELEDYLAAAL
jgi:hypothetical protein